MNDMLNFAMERACRIYGDENDGGVFTLSTLSEAICKIAGIKGVIDGDILRVILIGRDDIERLKGGCHYRLKERP